MIGIVGAIMIGTTSLRRGEGRFKLTSSHMTASVIWALAKAPTPAVSGFQGRPASESEWSGTHASICWVWITPEDLGAQTGICSVGISFCIVGKYLRSESLFFFLKKKEKRLYEDDADMF